MHQVHEQIGGKLIGVFTDTIVVEGDINKVSCDKILLVESEKLILKNLHN